MNKIMFAVFITVLGIAVWFSFKVKYEVRCAGHCFLVTWRTNPNIREATLFSSALIAGVVIFAVVQEWFL